VIGIAFETGLALVLLLVLAGQARSTRGGGVSRRRNPR